jgi:hypothetical protein
MLGLKSDTPNPGPPIVSRDKSISNAPRCNLGKLEQCKTDHDNQTHSNHIKLLSNVTLLERLV